MSEATEQRPLTPKQRLFVEKYLGEARWNATKAALLAGYPERSARSIGSENLTKPDIRAYIDARLAEAAMSANEVLGRLGDQARCTMEDFVQVDPETGRWSLDLPKAEAAGKLHLLHELGYTEHGPKIKLYDAQAALGQLGRHHKLFTDKADQTVSGNVEIHYTNDWRGNSEPKPPAGN